MNSLIGTTSFTFTADLLSYRDLSITFDVNCGNIKLSYFDITLVIEHLGSYAIPNIRIQNTFLSKNVVRISLLLGDFWLFEVQNGLTAAEFIKPIDKNFSKIQVIDEDEDVTAYEISSINSTEVIMLESIEVTTLENK